MGSITEIKESMAKYGMGHCDLPTMLDNVAVLTRVLTVNIDSKYKKGVSFTAFIVTLVSAVCYYYIYLFSMLWVVFVRTRITGEVVGAMVVLSLGISSEIGPMKLLYMRWQIDKVQKIADDYLDCDSQTIPGSRFEANLMKSLRNVKKRAIFYWMIVFGNGVLYLLKPAVIPGRNLPENYFTIYGLEPKFETPYYEIGCAMSIPAVFFICYVPATVTAYLIVIIGYTESQMIALAQEMLNLWPDALKYAKAQAETADYGSSFNELDTNNQIIINQFLKSRLREIIPRHALIVNLLHQVENMFRGAIAMGLLLLALGLLSELLGKLENTFLQLPFASMQVAMDCFAGQRVMDASILFEEAVYDCHWESFDKNNMKLILVMLQNAQKSMIVSAGGIATLNFSCLMTIMRGIYSAYTALRSTMK